MNQMRNKSRKDIAHLPEVRFDPDPGVLKLAEAYKETALLLFREDRLLVPGLVNAGFSLELYLKSLNMTWAVHDADNPPDGKSWVENRSAEQHGHDLVFLFTGLDVELIEQLNTSFAKREAEIRFVNLEAFLTKYRRLFEWFRYCFETTVIPQVDTQELTAGLKFFSETLSSMKSKIGY